MGYMRQPRREDQRYVVHRILVVDGPLRPQIQEVVEEQPRHRCRYQGLRQEVVEEGLHPILSQTQLSHPEVQASPRVRVGSRSLELV